MNKNRAYSADTLLVIALICAFTASVIMVLLLGIRIYNSITRASELAYSERTCMSYISEKLRHGDANGAVYVGKFDGLNAIYIDSAYGDTVYNDILYCYDGYLNELFCEKGEEFYKTDGTEIIGAESVSFTEPKAGLIYVEAVDLSKNTDRLYISLRSGG